MSLKEFISVPNYTIVLPSNKQNIKIRPFLVKEEKTLLIAKESKNAKEVYDCIKTVVQNCIVTPNIDVNKMCYFDVEYLFLKIRAKSMGEVIEILVTDPETTQKFETELNLENINVTSFNLKNKIVLNENLAVEMKYPNYEDFTEISASLVDSRLQRKDRIDFLLNILSICINKVYFKDSIVDCKELEKQEIKDFIDSLPKKEFDLLSDCVNDFPKIEYQGQFTNPTTGKSFPVEVRDFTDFFI